MQAIDAPGLAAKRGGELTGAVSAVPGVAGVRGLGLLVAVELDEGIDAKAVAAACLEAGLVLNAVTPTALRLAPPLTITEAEVDEAVAILASVLARHLNGPEGR
jgi:acetylornithine/succinyldiaminopimelate/putrescine aminotransferase